MQATMSDFWPSGSSPTHPSPGFQLAALSCIFFSFLTMIEARIMSRPRLLARVINLQHRADRWASFQQAWLPYSDAIGFTRMEAAKHGDAVSPDPQYSITPFVPRRMHANNTVSDVAEDGQPYVRASTVGARRMGNGCTASHARALYEAIHSEPRDRRPPVLAVVEDDVRPGYLYGPYINRLLDIAFSRLDDWDMISIGPSASVILPNAWKTNITFNCVPGSTVIPEALPMHSNECLILQASALLSTGFMLYNLRRRGEDILNGMTHHAEGYAASATQGATDIVLSSMLVFDKWVVPWVHQTTSYSDVVNMFMNYVPIFQAATMDLLAIRTLLQSLDASVPAGGKHETPLGDRWNLICVYAGDVEAFAKPNARDINVKTFRCEAAFGQVMHLSLGKTEQSLIPRVLEQYQYPLVANDHDFGLLAGLSNVFNAQGIVILPTSDVSETAKGANRWLPWLRRLHQRNTAPLSALHAQSLPLSLAAALSFLTMLHDMNGWTVNARTWEGKSIGTWTGMGPYLTPISGLHIEGEGSLLPVDVEYAAVPIIYPSCFEGALHTLNTSTRLPPSRLPPFYNATMVHVISLDSRCWPLGADMENVHIHLYLCEKSRSLASQVAAVREGFMRISSKMLLLMDLMHQRGYCVWRPADLAGIMFAKIDFGGYS
jgi:hypothetical protein